MLNVAKWIQAGSQAMSYEPDATGEQRFRSAATEGEPYRSDLEGEHLRSEAEQLRASAAGGMETAASTLREKAEFGTGRVASAAHSAADAISTSADYIREHDLSEMVEDLRDMVKANPGPALLCAAALGFLLGRAFARD